MPNHSGDCGVERARSGGVGGKRERVRAPRPNLRRERGEFGFAARQQGEVGALRREAPSGGRAYAARGADDQYHLVAQPEVHVRSAAPCRRPRTRSVR
jgi:hypothetical protein